jgi:hypothetical protein
VAESGKAYRLHSGQNQKPSNILQHAGLSTTTNSQCFYKGTSWDTTQVTQPPETHLTLYYLSFLKQHTWTGAECHSTTTKFG